VLSYFMLWLLGLEYPIRRTHEKATSEPT